MSINKRYPRWFFGEADGRNQYVAPPAQTEEEREEANQRWYRAMDKLPEAGNTTSRYIDPRPDERCTSCAAGTHHIESTEDDCACVCHYEDDAARGVKL